MSHAPFLTVPSRIRSVSCNEGRDRLWLMVRDRTSQGRVSPARPGFSLTRSSVHVWVWTERARLGRAQ